jgi:hypothetical protein
MQSTNTGYFKKGLNTIHTYPYMISLQDSAVVIATGYEPDFESR